MPTRPDQLHFKQPNVRVMGGRGPGQITFDLPELVDDRGYFVMDRQMPPVLFTVDPSAPLRFRKGATSATCNPENSRRCVTLFLFLTAPAGTYTVHIRADGYAPIDQEIRVTN